MTTRVSCIPQLNPDSSEKSWEHKLPSRAINLMDINLSTVEGAGSVPSRVSKERIMDVAELLTSSFDVLEHNLVDDDPRHNAIVWIFEKLPVSSMWKWNISENSSGLLISSWTPKITEERRLDFNRSEIFCIHDSNIFAGLVSLECNWWILTSAKPAIFFSMNMDLGRKDRDQAISCSETWSMLFTACKLWISLNSEISEDVLNFWASMIEKFKQIQCRLKIVPSFLWQKLGRGLRTQMLDGQGRNKQLQDLRIYSSRFLGDHGQPTLRCNAASSASSPGAGSQQYCRTVVFSALHTPWPPRNIGHRNHRFRARASLSEPRSIQISKS